MKTASDAVTITKGAADASAAPRVIVFACRWCALIGADAAGKQRQPLPVGFRVIPVECIARVEPDAVIRAFSRGIDGVAVLGCHLGGCRYNGANHRCFKRLELLKGLLATVGIDPGRLLTSFGTGHEYHQYARLMQDFMEGLRLLPPLAGGHALPENMGSGVEHDDAR